MPNNNVDSKNQVPSTYSYHVSEQILLLLMLIKSRDFLCVYSNKGIAELTSYRDMFFSFEMFMTNFLLHHKDYITE